MNPADADPAASLIQSDVPARVDEYEIISPVGRGGMGQVYLARDTLLGRSVAIKFLAAESPSEQARERLLIEARAIARIQHPNIVSLYRVGVVRGRPYLAAEFLDGHSLDRKPLPMPWRSALDLGVQLARGLVAAHRQGVLHRDIKPANVMMTTDGTAKLLDFGVAKLDETADIVGIASEHVRVRARMSGEEPAVEPAALAQTLDAPEPALHGRAEPLPMVRSAVSDSGASHEMLSQTTPGVALRRLSQSAQSLTTTGSVIGTPLYMAPEAWRGERASAANDIYSLGALLYELCNGRPPHDYPTMEEIYTAATGRDARPLATVAPTVDKDFAAAVDRCLQREPTQRFASADELLSELESLVSASSAATTRGLKQKTRRKRLAVGLLLVAMMLVSPLTAMTSLYKERARQPRDEALRANRRAVAVLGLADLAKTAASSGFSAAFAELLGDELGTGEYLRRVPPESVARMKLDLGLAAAPGYAPAVVADIRRYLLADLLVAGSVELDGGHSDRLQVRVLVLDSRSGAQVATAVVRGNTGELFELVARTGSELRQQLGLGVLSAAEKAALSAVRPLSRKVAQAYAQGRELLRRFDAVAARRLIERVVTDEPSYPLGHLAMAEVWTALGYDERAKAEAKRAVETSSGLAREDRYVIEARYDEASKAWDKAAAAYETLLTFFPDSIEYRLYLGNAQLAGGRPKDTLHTVQKLRMLPSPANQDPRLDILEARALSDLGDLHNAVAMLERAASQGAVMRAPLLVARARLEAAYALEYAGQHRRSLDSAAVARNLFGAAGDRSATADALSVIAAAHMHQGELAQALQIAQESLELLYRIKNSALIANTLCNMSLLSIQTGQLALARAQAQGGVALAGEIGLTEMVGAGSIALAWIDLLGGNLADAEQWLQEAAEVLGETGDPKMVAWVKWQTGQLLLAKAKFADAEKQFAEALHLQEEHGLNGFAAESRAALAATAFEKHEPRTAAALARAAANQFAAEQQTDQEAWAQALLSEALADQGEAREAQQALQRARVLSDHSQNLAVRLFVTRASLMQKIHHPESNAPYKDAKDLQRELAAALAAAQASGMRVEELELRLMEQTAAFQREPGPEARLKILALAQEATQRGLLLLAKKASDAAQASQ